MKTFKVKYTEDFLVDLKNITRHIKTQTCSQHIARHFAEGVIDAIEKRSFAAASYEKMIVNGIEYFRIYYGKYIVFYSVSGDIMTIKRILWSGADITGKMD